MLINEDVTLWRMSGLNEYSEATFNTPVTIKAKWEEKQTIMHTNDGEQVLSNGCLFVNVDADVEDYVFRGISTDANPLNLKRSFKVRKVERIKNFNGSKTEVKLCL